MTKSTFRPLTKSEVTFTITTHLELTSVRGNALISGNATTDREAEDDIIAQLDAGDETAWCTVVVTATAPDDTEATDTLGCVTISELNTLEECVSDHDMYVRALERLNADIAATEFGAPVLALATYLNVNPTMIETDHADMLCDGAEYRVMTDTEADHAFRDYMSDYIDECVLEQLPTAFRGYFDDEAYTRDVLISDGRGPSLANYDGEERSAQVDGEWYYIYRVG